MCRRGKGLCRDLVPLGTLWAAVEARAGRAVAGPCGAQSRLGLRITVRCCGGGDSVAAGPGSAAARRRQGLCRPCRGREPGGGALPGDSRRKRSGCDELWLWRRPAGGRCIAALLADPALAAEVGAAVHDRPCPPGAAPDLLCGAWPRGGAGARRRDGAGRAAPVHRVGGVGPARLCRGRKRAAVAGVTDASTARTLRCRGPSGGAAGWRGCARGATMAPPCARSICALPRGSRTTDHSIRETTAMVAQNARTSW